MHRARGGVQASRELAAAQCEPSLPRETSPPPSHATTARQVGRGGFADVFQITFSSNNRNGWKADGAGVRSRKPGRGVNAIKKDAATCQRGQFCAGQHEVRCGERFGQRPAAVPASLVRRGGGGRAAAACSPLPHQRPQPIHGNAANKNGTKGEANTARCRAAQRSPPPSVLPPYCADTATVAARSPSTVAVKVFRSNKGRKGKRGNHGKNQNAGQKEPRKAAPAATMLAADTAKAKEPCAAPSPPAAPHPCTSCVNSEGGGVAVANSCARERHASQSAVLSSGGSENTSTTDALHHVQMASTTSTGLSTPRTHELRMLAYIDAVVQPPSRRLVRYYGTAKKAAVLPMLPSTAAPFPRNRMMQGGSRVAAQGGSRECEGEHFVFSASPRESAATTATSSEVAVLEYLSGGPIHVFMQAHDTAIAESRDNLDENTNSELCLIRWFRQAAEALACLHRHGIIHRDVKPDNLLLRLPKQRGHSTNPLVEEVAGAEVVLSDFGAAEVIRPFPNTEQERRGPASMADKAAANTAPAADGAEHQRRGHRHRRLSVLGTPGYCPPEIAQLWGLDTFLTAAAADMPEGEAGSDAVAKREPSTTCRSSLGRRAMASKSSSLSSSSSSDADSRCLSPAELAAAADVYSLGVCFYMFLTCPLDDMATAGAVGLPYLHLAFHSVRHGNNSRSRRGGRRASQLESVWQLSLVMSAMGQYPKLRDLLTSRRVGDNSLSLLSCLSSASDSWTSSAMSVCSRSCSFSTSPSLPLFSNVGHMSSPMTVWEGEGMGDNGVDAWERENGNSISEINRSVAGGGRHLWFCLAGDEEGAVRDYAEGTWASSDEDPLLLPPCPLGESSASMDKGKAADCQHPSPRRQPPPATTPSARTVSTCPLGGEPGSTTQDSSSINNVHHGEYPSWNPVWVHPDNNNVAVDEFYFYGYEDDGRSGVEGRRGHANDLQAGDAGREDEDDTDATMYTCEALHNDDDESGCTNSANKADTRMHRRRCVVVPTARNPIDRDARGSHPPPRQPFSLSASSEEAKRRSQERLLCASYANDPLQSALCLGNPASRTMAMGQATTCDTDTATTRSPLAQHRCRAAFCVWDSDNTGGGGGGRGQRSSSSSSAEKRMDGGYNCHCSCCFAPRSSGPQDYPRHGSAVGTWIAQQEPISTDGVEGMMLALPPPSPPLLPRASLLKTISGPDGKHRLRARRSKRGSKNRSAHRSKGELPFRFPSYRDDQRFSLPACTGNEDGNDSTSLAEQRSQVYPPLSVEEWIDEDDDDDGFDLPVVKRPSTSLQLQQLLRTPSPSCGPALADARKNHSHRVGNTLSPSSSCLSRAGGRPSHRRHQEPPRSRAPQRRRRRLASLLMVEQMTHQLQRWRMPLPFFALIDAMMDATASARPTMEETLVVLDMLFPRDGAEGGEGGSKGWATDETTTTTT